MSDRRQIIPILLLGAIALSSLCPAFALARLSGISADRDIHFNAGHGGHDWSQNTHSHHDSLLSSATTTTHDEAAATGAITARIKGQNVELHAGHDIHLEAADTVQRH